MQGFVNYCPFAQVYDNDCTRLSDTSGNLRTRKLAVTLIPAIIQLAIVAFIFDWAAGKGSGRGLMGLGIVFVMVVAVPVTYIANSWIVKETNNWNFFWALLLGVAQGLLIPIGIVLSFL